jgi:transcription-repair coupling factor (superfamily II helicase)
MALPSLLEALERLPAFGRVVNGLPAPGQVVQVAGLHGSSDAVLVAALAGHHRNRLFVVVTDAVPDAERWLGDLATLLDEAPVALYPPREGFSDAEPHAEIAGERVETLERLLRGSVRVLLTTTRALMERTALPSAIGTATGTAEGPFFRPRNRRALDGIGFERVR